MIRIAVVGLHGGIAALTAVNAIFLLIQGQMNLAWETGFYRAPSLLTQAYLGGSAFAVTLAFLQLALSVGVLLNQPWAMRGLLALTVMLTFVVPPPWNALLLLLTWTAAMASRPKPGPDPVES